MSEVGTEVSKDSSYDLSNFFAGTTDTTNLYWIDSSGAYHSGWPAHAWYDRPCGLSGYTNPTCFNSVWYSANHYASNKP